MAKKIDPSIVYGLAGIFAVSNMGQPLPSVESVKRWRASERDSADADDALSFFCAAYIEDDFSEKVMLKEVKYWAAYVRKNGLLGVKVHHADILKLWDDAAPEKEWSGSPCPDDPDNFWIDDKTGERVNAHTGERKSNA